MPNLHQRQCVLKLKLYIFKQIFESFLKRGCIKIGSRLFTRREHQTKNKRNLRRSLYTILDVSRITSHLLTRNRLYADT